MIKRELIWIVLILVSSILLSIGFFRNGVYSSHDGEIHIARLAQFNQSLREGQFPVRWISAWNNNLGYPAFVYVYSLPYYLGSFLRIFGLSFETIFKSLMFLSLSLSGITFYVFAKTRFSSISSFVGSLFYISTPYRFADIYERGALGESMVFIFLPLLFLVPKTIVKKTQIGFLFSGFVIFSLITTHALTFLIFIPPAIIYSIFVFKRNARQYLIYFLSIIFGFLLSSFQWIPMIFEQKYLDLNSTYFNLFNDHLISVFQLLRIPKEGINIGTGIQIGLQSSVILIFAALYLIKNNKQSSLLLFFISCSAVAGFLSTDLSRNVWINLKILHPILFPWRFITLITFSVAVISSLLISQSAKLHLKILLAVFFSLLTIIPSRHYMLGKNYHTFPDDYYKNYTDPESLDKYFLPKEIVSSNDRPLNASIIKGRGIVISADKKANRQEIELLLNEPSLVQMSTLYFPGWKLYLDQKEQKIITDARGYEGIIVGQIPSGQHKVLIKLEETTIRRFSNMSTLSSFLFLVIFLSYKTLNIKMTKSKIRV